jgi:hypothetical protein
MKECMGSAAGFNQVKARHNKDEVVEGTNAGIEQLGTAWELVDEPTACNEEQQTEVAQQETRE